MFVILLHNEKERAMDNYSRDRGAIAALLHRKNHEDRVEHERSASLEDWHLRHRKKIRRRMLDGAVFRVGETVSIRDSNCSQATIVGVVHGIGGPKVTVSFANGRTEQIGLNMIQKH